MGGEGGTVASEPTFEASCSIPICFQEQEKEARSRAAYISALPASPHWRRGFDDDKDEDKGPPGGCGPAGGSGGDFNRLVF